jgi:ribulose-phosphate 3-epimerase
VPNLTIGAPVVKSLRARTRAFLDCHLMVTHPERWVDAFAQAGADGFTFHVEVDCDKRALIERARALGMRVGIALKPDTPLSALEPFLPSPAAEAAESGAASSAEGAPVGGVDMVLIMTVEPGFGGQSFRPEMLAKVRRCGALVVIAA